MNADYAHLLPGSKLDFTRLGRALQAVAAGPDCSFRMIARNAGVDEITIRRASRHQKISAESYLKICIALDLDPFDCLVKQEGVSREHTTVAPCRKAV